MLNHVKDQTSLEKLCYIGHLKLYSHHNTSLFYQTETQSRHMKRGSSFLVIREMQIKTPTEYYLTLVRRAMVKKCWRGHGEKEALSYH